MGKYTIDCRKDSNLGLRKKTPSDLHYIPEYYYIHRHIPFTYTMNVYIKKFPSVNIPKYQIALVLRKEKILL